MCACEGVCMGVCVHVKVLGCVDVRGVHGGGVHGGCVHVRVCMEGMCMCVHVRMWGCCACEGCACEGVCMRMSMCVWMMQPLLLGCLMLAQVKAETNVL